MRSKLNVETFIYRRSSCLEAAIAKLAFHKPFLVTFLGFISKAIRVSLYIAQQIFSFHNPDFSSSISFYNEFPTIKKIISSLGSQVAPG